MPQSVKKPRLAANNDIFVKKTSRSKAPDFVDRTRFKRAWYVSAEKKQLQQLP